MSVFEEKENELLVRRAELQEKLKALTEVQHQLEIIESNLELLNEMKPKASSGQFTLPLNSATKELLETPAVPIGMTMIEGMKALGQFTKNDVVAWVKQQYPKLEFSDKSMQRPLRDMVDSGQVVLLKKNQGSKSQAVYGIKRK